MEFIKFDTEITVPATHIGPIRIIPEELRDSYTMSGKIPVIDCYMEGNIVSELQASRMNWTPEVINRFVSNWTRDKIITNSHGQEPYAGVGKMFVSAFDKYFPKKPKVAVIGSLDPWIEALCINCRSTSTTTIEYNVPTCEDPRFKTMSFNDYSAVEDEFDVAITYSSVEHSGLGRYGDTLDSDGDIMTMKAIHKSLKKDGLLFWGAPVNPEKDVLVWNACRIYGNIRTPLLFEGFTILDHIEDGNRHQIATEIFSQPLVILKKQ